MVMASILSLSLSLPNSQSLVSYFFFLFPFPSPHSPTIALSLRTPTKSPILLPLVRSIIVPLVQTLYYAPLSFSFILTFQQAEATPGVKAVVLRHRSNEEIYFSRP